MGSNFCMKQRWLGIGICFTGLIWWLRFWLGCLFLGWVGDCECGWDRCSWAELVVAFVRSPSEAQLYMWLLVLGVYINEFCPCVYACVLLHKCTDTGPASFFPDNKTPCSHIVVKHRYNHQINNGKDYNGILCIILSSFIFSSLSFVSGNNWSNRYCSLEYVIIVPGIWLYVR